jgi:hypothetical protein
MTTQSASRRRRLFALLTGILCSGYAIPSAAAPIALRFEPNQGQTAPVVRFLARGPGYTLFLTPTESVMVLPAGSSAGASHGASADLRMKLLGSNRAAKATALEPLAGTASYFVGNDPERWRKAIPTFARVRIDEVYPGIDLVYYGSEGRLEYDFVARPGSDPAKIAFQVAGTDTVEIDPSGDLVLSAAGRRVRWHKPVCYQEIDGQRRSVDGAYERTGKDGFAFRVGSYDPKHALVIDPTLVYATYLAPTTFAAGDGLQNAALAIAVDADGNAYVAGITESASFPTTAGAFRTTRPGKRDVFIAKLNPAASALVYATYLGGAENEIQNARGVGIAVDAAGNAYVASSSSSTDFPTTAGAYQTTNQGFDDAFVVKLDPSGANLVYSTLIGGPGIEYGWGVALNADGEAFVCGETNGNFPTTPGAYQTASISLSGFVSKVAADGASLVYSTTVGTNTGKAKAIVLDADGNAYITGGASKQQGATGWPVTPGAFQALGVGSFDAFVTKLNPQGSALVFSTYLGGSANEDGHGIALDGARNVYVAGVTNSTNFPVTAGAFQGSFQSTPFPEDDGFVVKLDATGSTEVYGTYLGTAAGDDLTAIVVDADGNAIVSGGTPSTSFPTTPDAFQPTFTPTQLAGSAIVTKFNATGTALVYSTYIHPTQQNGGSAIYAVTLDDAGSLYMAGTSGPAFPTTPGVFQGTTFNPAFGGPLVAKLDLGAAATACGDFNADGRITAGDALGALRSALGSQTCALEVCDYNGDTRLTAGDALAILRVAVGDTIVAKCP